MKLNTKRFKNFQMQFNSQEADICGDKNYKRVVAPLVVSNTITYYCLSMH